MPTLADMLKPEQFDYMLTEAEEQAYEERQERLAEQVYWDLVERKRTFMQAMRYGLPVAEYREYDRAGGVLEPLMSTYGTWCGLTLELREYINRND